MENYKDRMEIDLKDLAVRLVKRWKLIVIFALIGVILGGVVSYFLIPQPEAVTEEVTEEEVVSSPERVWINNMVNDKRLLLNQKDALQAEMGLELYKSYMQSYREAKDYIDKSIYLSLDANALPTVNNTYLISNYEDEDAVLDDSVSEVDNIVFMYQRCLQDESFIKSVADVIGAGDREIYVKELFGAQKQGKSIMYVYAFAHNRQECDAIMEILDKKIMAEHESINREIGHDIKLVSSTYSESYSTGLLEAQRNWLDKLNATKSALLAIPTSFFAEQKAYYDALTYRYWYEDASGEIISDIVITDNSADAEQEESVDTVVATAQKRNISVKWIILGALAGAFLAMSYITIKYALSPRLRVPNDISYVYDINNIGTIKGKSADVDIRMVASEILVGAGKKNAHRIVFSGAELDQSVKNIMNAVSNELKDLDIVITGSFANDPGSMEIAGTSDAVVIYEKIDNSLYRDIEKEANFCKNCGIYLMGAVVLDGDIC